jgi:hypothetical protein
VLTDGDSVDWLIRALEANKPLLPKKTEPPKNDDAANLGALFQKKNRIPKEKPPSGGFLYQVNAPLALDRGSRGALTPLPDAS